jgi:CheY-like chemotaxis protein/bifunctional DNA-binding transcriptional regulator/antitoxin component of YhaV-PrlF toxin-antitoxin module
LYFKERKNEHSSIDNVNSSFNHNRLINIDALSVDKNSRITLTKKVKEVFPLAPGDRVVIYQDRYNKNLILEIQQQDRVVDRWIIARDRNANSIRNSKYVEKNIIHAGFENSFKMASIGVNKIEDNLKPPIERYSTPILLVDDDEDSLMLFKNLLNSEGYTNIESFSDPRKVLKNISSLKDPSYYKLAILDIRIQGINGIQLYNILKILNPSLNVLFMTILDAISELTSLFPEVKEADILRKPADIGEFIRVVNYKVNSIS